jgi:integrase
MGALVAWIGSAMPKLIKRVVDAATPRDREYFVWDDEMRGFGLRVLPSGRRIYLIQYRVGRRTRRLKLGPHGVLTPAAARRKAAELLAEALNGGDPSADRKAAGITVADLGERYLREHAATKKKPSSAASDRRNLRRHVLPTLGNSPIAAVTRSDVARLHHALRKTPGAANRVVALLSKMMSLAEQWGLRPDGSNPCRHVQRYAERRIERFLSTAELARLGETLSELEAAGAEPAPVIAAIRLLILTGARRSEILNLRWEDVDFERGALRLPDSKTGPKSIPLNAPALEVLASLERTSEWVLPTDEGQGPVSLSKPWGRIRDRAGLEDLRVHDLRHSFASVGAGAGLGLPIIGKLLGHTQPATTNRYAHLADDPVRQASEAIGSRIAAAMGAGSGAEVVPLLDWTKPLSRRSGRADS